MNEENTTAAHDARSEWIKFGVLVAVFVIVILVVALSRPLIFGRIVPAVMGDGQVAMPADSSPEEVQPVSEPEGQPATDEATNNEAYPAPGEVAPVEEGATPADNTDTAAPITGEQTPTTEETTTEQPTSAADAPQPPNTFTYTVRAGDTLYQIARRYNTTPEAIVAASSNLNSLNDVITPGMEIMIPQP